MEAKAMATAGKRPRRRDRVAARLVLLLLAIGSLVLWIAIPAGGLWLTGELADDARDQFLYALLLIPATMGVFALALIWLNRLYLRITGALREGELHEDGRWRTLRGPLEPLMVNSLMFAVVAMLVWFFVFAENPPSCAGNP